jgi:iron complex outermembrane receptor protein
VKQFPGADINGDLQNIASIVRPGNAPSTTANAAFTFSDYLGDGDIRLTARLGYTYTSSQTFFANPLTAPFQEETSAGSRSLLNGQLRFSEISIGNGPEFSVSLWGRNITNKKYVSRGIDFGQLGYGSVIFGPPATYGLDLEFSF